MMNIIYNIFSTVLGSIDYIILLIGLIIPRRFKFFTKGLGDFDKAYMKQKQMQEQQEEIKTLTDKDLIWIDYKQLLLHEQDNITIRQGQFLSPLADVLPSESKYCQFYLVEPLKKKSIITTTTTTGQKQKQQHQPAVYIVMLPATGEVGKTSRLRMAKYFAQNYSWSSIIIIAPYYGKRKPKKQKLYFMNTVADIVYQAQAIIYETVTLINYLLQKHSDSKICITGFSWGGAMSACVSSIVLQTATSIKNQNNNNDIGNRLACVPYVGCATPAVIVDGTLQSIIDWQVFGSDNNKDKVYKFLYEKLYKIQLKDTYNKEECSNNNDNRNNNSNEKMKKRQQQIAIIKPVIMMHDGIISTKHVNEFLHQLHGLGSFEKVITLPGGHIIAMLLRRWVHRNTIIQAVNELISIKEPKKKQNRVVSSFFVVVV